MKFFAILICKFIAFVGKFMNKGTSLPGAVALKICPDILSKLNLPDKIIAVTGSNGKTSTVEMIANILTNDGKKIAYNKEGSNQIEGVTTFLLKNASLSGKVDCDVVLLESDERYARHTFKYLKPTHFVVTNLYRDQLTRNVHPFRIFSIIKDAVDLIPNATLILNGDDPIISQYGIDRENTLYFGMDRNEYSTEKTDALYNDCCYCPVCKEKMEYEYFHYAHLGGFYCPHCSYKKSKTDYTVDKLDLKNRVMSVNGNEIELAFASRYNVYNICSAFAICSLLGVSDKVITDTLNDFIMKNGRIVKFKAGENEGFLITSKHENSTSYNQTLEYVSSQEEQSTLVVIIDAVSRKYYTTEISWIWDISFEKLVNSNVKRILLCGKYSYDLAVRFEEISFVDTEIIVEPDLDKMAEIISQPSDDKLFVTTCFSDKGKLLSRVEIETDIDKI